LIGAATIINEGETAIMGIVTQAPVSSGSDDPVRPFVRAQPKRRKRVALRATHHVAQSEIRSEYGVKPIYGHVLRLHQSNSLARLVVDQHKGTYPAS
jgi:hypothetical protein